MKLTPKTFRVLSIFRESKLLLNNVPWQWLFLIAVALMLQGCFEVEAHFTFHNDDTYDSTITFVADEILGGEELALAIWRTGFIFPEVSKTYQHSMERFRKSGTRYVRHTYQSRGNPVSMFEKRDDFEIRKLKSGQYMFQAELPKLLEKVSDNDKDDRVLTIAVSFPTEIDIANSPYVEGNTVRWVLTKEIFLKGATLKARTKEGNELIQNDWEIVPGERVGPITVHTSIQDLMHAFGAENVECEGIHVGEGDYVFGTIVYPLEPEKRLGILWKVHEQVPAEIRLNGDRSLWKTKQGLTLGSSLKDIERLNEKPFRLAGFGWDYGGTIVDCNGGALRELGCGERGYVNRTLLLRLSGAGPAGDGYLLSDNPEMQKANPVIYEMVVDIDAGTTPVTRGYDSTGSYFGEGSLEDCENVKNKFAEKYGRCRCAVP